MYVRPYVLYQKHTRVQARDVQLPSFNIVDLVVSKIGDNLSNWIHGVVRTTVESATGHKKASQREGSYHVTATTGLARFFALLW